MGQTSFFLCETGGIIDIIFSETIIKKIKEAFTEPGT